MLLRCETRSNDNDFVVTWRRDSNYYTIRISPTSPNAPRRCGALTYSRLESILVISSAARASVKCAPFCS